MADKYKGWVVENAHKPAFRTVYQRDLGCKDMHGISKAKLLEIALDFDRRHHPLSLSDPNIKNKVNAAQLTEVRHAVAKARPKKNGVKTDAGDTEQNDKEAAASSEQVQETKTTTARSGKSKAHVQEGGATSDDSPAANPGQEGDVHMAEAEDVAEAAPPVDLTAEAVPSPVDDNRKGKRTDTVSSFDTERAGTVRPKTSLIVKLKLRSSAMVGTRGMQTTTQGLGVHQGQNQVAEDTRPVKARRLVDKPGSRLQHGLARPPALARSTESGKKDSDNAVAGGLGDVFGTADPANALEQRSSRRQPQRMNKKKASVPVGDTSEETNETSEGDPKDTVAGQDVGEKLDSDANSLAEEDDPTWPKDKNGKPVIFGSDGTIVCYLYEETEEEEKLFPYNWLNGPERMRRNERQARRRRAQAEKEAAARGEEYVPKPKKEPYDWTKHM